MNQTQKGVLIAIVVALLGGVGYVALKPQKESAPEAAGDAASSAAAPAQPASSMTDLGATVDKTSRLIAEASAATAEMKTLYKDGKAAEPAPLAAARGKAETALNGVVAIEIPESAEGAPADMVRKARDNAGKALGILKTLPADPAGALAALGEIEAVLSGKAPEVAAEPAKPAPATASATAEAAAPAAEPAAPAAPAVSVPAAPEAAAEIASTPPVAPAPAEGTEIASNGPAFDLLRVEPDGSTVIAGRAAEGDKIEILDGEKVVSSTLANAGGDFAAVFEEPLPPGDHQLTIRAIRKDGQTVTSQEVATVSVPRDQKGDLLAMVSKPGTASRLITAPGARPSQEPAADTAAPATAETAAAPQTAAAPATPSAAPAATVKAALQISAVELEGDRIFVAGTADPQSTVTAYADDRPIGQDTTGADGHFVVDGLVPLSVGQHRIRVDQTGPDGKVAFRVEVPFDRPEGEQFAAVASAGTASSDAGSASAPAQPTADGAFGAARGDAVKAFGLLQALFADGKTPTTEQYAAARSATAIALQRLVDAATAEAAQQTVRASAQKALALVKALPASPAGAGSALAAIEALIREIEGPAGMEAAPAPAAAADTTATGEAAATPAAPATAAPGEPAQVAQAPLTEAKNTVIIRRGDTLWQISRRVYGLGVRYTTIYLANREQITNPDRILPGQVFGVPDEALPNAEQLHWKRLHGETIQ